MAHIEINEIDLEKCRPCKDFGKGFYLTTIREQAEKMAVRVASIYGGEPYVTIYRYDESALTDKGIMVKRFEVPTKEWALFVINNRSREFKDITSMDCLFYFVSFLMD